MNFKISSKIFEKFSGFNMGVVIGNNINNNLETKEIMELLRKQEAETKEKFETVELSQHPNIFPWRQAYSSFGAKPKKYKCCIEALIRRTLRDVPLPQINNLVDLYNYLSLKHVLPIGGDDLDKIDGNITLGLAEGTEKFIELGTDGVKNPKSGEVVYADDKEVLCRRWNWRECDKTKLISESKNVILYIEGLPPVTKADVEKATNETVELVKKYCGGTIEKHILNSEKQEIEIK